MKKSKFLLVTLIVTIVSVIYGGLTCGWLFRGVYTLEPTNIWKNIQAPPAIFYIGVFLLNLLLVWVYTIFSKVLPSKSLLAKGAVFGILVWLIGTLPGMFFCTVFTVIAPLVILYWTINDFVLLILKGIIIAKLWK